MQKEITPAQMAQQLLADLLMKTLISFTTIEASEPEDGVIRLNVVTDEPAHMIGRRGETLFAVQQVLRMIARRQLGEDTEIVLDVDDYRRNQERNAELIARDVATRVRDTGESSELAPMPSYKRRAVHTFLAATEFADLTVYSVGEGEDRRIRIEPKSGSITLEASQSPKAPDSVLL